MLEVHSLQVLLQSLNWSYLLPLLLLLLLLHTLLYLTQQAGRMGGEGLKAVLLRQLRQLGSDLPAGRLDLLELQLVPSQLDTAKDVEPGVTGVTLK